MSTKQTLNSSFGKAMIGALGLMFLMSGCLGLGKNDNALMQADTQSSIAAGIGGMAGFKQTVYPFVRANCIECHGVTQAPTFAVDDVNTAYTIALQNVNFSSPSFSLLAVQAGNGHCGTSGCNGNTAAMIALIQNWYKAFQTAGGGTSAPTTTVLTGNVFTSPITIPSPNPTSCILPDGLACTADGKDSEDPTFIPDPNNPNKQIPIPTDCTNTCWTKLRYPVTGMTPKITDPTLQRAWFEVDFAYENYTSVQGFASYVIKNPRVVSPDGPVYIHDIRMFINGVYQPQYGEDYQTVDEVVDAWDTTNPKSALGCSIPPAPTPFDPNILNGMHDAAGDQCIPSVPALPSTAESASGILQVNDPTKGPADTISFSFDYFQVGQTKPCANQALWLTNVYTPIKIGAVACLSCHRSGGGVTEAGQRFNMDDTDPVNNGIDPKTGNATIATLAARQATICEKFLQRTNLSQPAQSSIIVQPLAGLNGMPAQANFGYFEPNWIDWISAEAKSQGK